MNLSKLDTADNRRARVGAHGPKHAAPADHGWRRMIRRNAERALAAEIRACADDLFRHVDELHYSHRWPYEYAEEQAFNAVLEARREVGQNPEMTEEQMLEALLPVTEKWWPEPSPLVAPARHAVEQIRRLAILARYEPAERPSDPGWRHVA